MGALGILLRRHADDYGIGFCFCFLALPRLQASARVIFAFGACFSNTVMLGIPIILTAFGPAAGLPFFMVLAFHGLLVFTTALVCLEFGDQGKCPPGANYPTIGPRHARPNGHIGAAGRCDLEFFRPWFGRAGLTAFSRFWAVQPFPSR